MSVLHWMVEDGIKSNRITYSSLIKACGSAEPARVDGAMSVLDRMVKEGIVVIGNPGDGMAQQPRDLA